MATHSSVLAWRIPGMGGSLVGFRLWGRTESDMTDATYQLLCFLEDLGFVKKQIKTGFLHIKVTGRNKI